MSNSFELRKPFHGGPSHCDHNSGRDRGSSSGTRGTHSSRRQRNETGFHGTPASTPSSAARARLVLKLGRLARLVANFGVLSQTLTEHFERCIGSLRFLPTHVARSVQPTAPGVVRSFTSPVQRRNLSEDSAALILSPSSRPSVM